MMALAWLLRSRPYAIFRGVLVAIHNLVVLGLAERFAAPGAFGLELGDPSPIWVAFLALHATVYIQAFGLIRARMMPLPYRLFVSLPAMTFAAGTLLAFPWAILQAVGLEPWAPWLPYAVALVGLLQSLTSRREDVHLVVADGRSVDGVRRVEPSAERSDRPLRVVQITDPHLGPFMSVSRLRRICERAVAAEPDLVLLTGDFLTMESQRTSATLRDAFSPLKQLSGRVFACRGNHDHEAPELVAEALADNDIKLLNDECALVDTPAGKVQVVGLDYVFGSQRRERMQAACERCPREAGALRVVLLHDPGAFKHLPEGEADLVLSGHTHGGQLGLVSLGLKWTFVSGFSKMPDHGFWGRGTDRLYVHRGTGHYGFPLRIGVPTEESVLHVHIPQS